MRFEMNENQKIILWCLYYLLDPYKRSDGL